MNRSYRIAFQVTLDHSYYTSGQTPDFSILPTRDTMSWLKENKMLFRSDETGFRVFYTAAPFVPFTEKELRFMLVLKEGTRFFNITDLNVGGEDYTSGDLLLFKNSGLTSELTPGILPGAESKVFTYVFPQKSENPEALGQLEIRDEAGNIIPLEIPDPDTIPRTAEKEFRYPVDLSKYPEGVYDFKTSLSDNPEVITKQIYVDEQVKRQSAFGLIRITLTEEVLTTSFKAQFATKQPYWRYHFVIKNMTADDYVFSVEDQLGEYSFVQTNNDEMNGYPVVVFDSEQLIPLSELPRKKLRFIREQDGVRSTLVSNLSNPVVNIVNEDVGEPNVSNVFVYI